MSTEPEQLRILIADDHAVVRRGLRELLADQFPAAAFGEAGTSSQALELVWKEPWDVVVLDINMPGRSGLDALKEIRQARPALPVLVLSVHSEEQYALRVIKAGAAGYVCKDVADQQLVAAVRKVLEGGRYVSPSLAQQLAAAIAQDTSRPVHELLSDREFEVFRALAAGRTVSEIAGDLSLSVKTISTYRTRILEKLDLHNNAEIMRYAVDHGFEKQG